MNPANISCPRQRRRERLSKHNIGYACQHRGSALTSGRTLRLATVERSGGAGALEMIGKKTLENLLDVESMLRFNVENRIRCLRISMVIPWCDKVSDLTTLGDYDKIDASVKRINELATNNFLRITTHPGQYVCLGSPNPDVRRRSIVELEQHGRMFDLLGLERSTYNKINIHVGGSYGGDFSGTAARFAESFDQLSDSVRSRLTVENDDKPNCWSVTRLNEHVRPAIAALGHQPPPIVFDSLHWQLGPQDNEIDADYDRALQEALETWDGPEVPIVHHSQSASGKNPRAHSDRYTAPFKPAWLEHSASQGCLGYDIMLEAKDKELAALDYINDFLTQ